MKTEAIRIVKSAGDMLKLQNSLDRRIARIRLFFFGSMVALTLTAALVLILYVKGAGCPSVY